MDKATKNMINFGDRKTYRMSRRTRMLEEYTTLSMRSACHHGALYRSHITAVLISVPRGIPERTLPPQQDKVAVSPLKQGAFAVYEQSWWKLLSISIDRKRVILSTQQAVLSCSTACSRSAEALDCAFSQSATSAAILQELSKRPNHAWS